MKRFVTAATLCIVGFLAWNLRAPSEEAGLAPTEPQVSGAIDPSRQPDRSEASEQAMIGPQPEATARTDGHTALQQAEASRPKYPETTIKLQFYDALSGDPVTGFLAGVGGYKGSLGFPRSMSRGKEERYISERLYPVDTSGTLTLHVPPDRPMYVGMKEDIDTRDYVFERYKKVPVTIDPVDSGQRREVAIPLEPRKRVPMHIRFVDAQSQAPVAGVKLGGAYRGNSGWGLLRRNTAQKAWEIRGEPQAQSDSAGRVTLEVLPNAPAIWEVHAESYGPALVFGTVIAQDPSKPLIVSLHPLGRLRGKILGEVPGGFSTLEVGVHLNPAEHGGGRTRQSSWAATIVRASALVESDGTFQFEDFPTPGRVHISISWNGQEVHSNTFIAYPGEDQVYEWTWGENRTLKGWLFDDEGRPRPETTVWLNKSRGNVRYSTLSVGSKPWKTATTNENGFFEVPHLAEGRYVVGPEPVKGFKPHYAVTVEVPGRVHIIKPPELASVAGRVWHGETPMAGVTVLSNQRFSSITGPSGRFHLDCYPDDPVTVAVDDPVIDGVSYLGVEGVDTVPGDHHIVLRLEKPAHWTAFAIDAKTREPLDVKWEYSRLRDPMPIQTTSPWRSRWEIHGEVPGPFRMWASTQDGRVACTHTIISKPGENLGRIPLELSQGGAVTLTSDHHVVADFFQVGQPIRAAILDRESGVLWFPPGEYEATPRSGTLRPKSFSVVAGKTTLLTWAP